MKLAKNGRFFKIGGIKVLFIFFLSLAIMMPSVASAKDNIARELDFAIGGTKFLKEEALLINNDIYDGEKEHPFCALAQ